jgi:hypothetical protein
MRYRATEWCFAEGMFSAALVLLPCDGMRASQAAGCQGSRRPGQRLRPENLGTNASRHGELQLSTTDVADAGANNDVLVGRCRWPAHN